MAGWRTGDVTQARERWPRAWVATYALGTLVAAGGWLAQRLGAPSPFWLNLLFGLVNVPVAPSLVSAVVCALIAGALLRRKAAGLAAAAFWQAVGVYMGIASLARLPEWDRIHSWWAPRTVTWASDVVSIPIGLALLVLLWRRRRDFPARLRPGSWARSLAVLAAGTAGTGLLVGGLLLATGRRPGDLADDEWALLTRMIGVSARPIERLAAVPGWIVQLASLLVALTIVATVLVFLRTGHDPHSWSGDQELALRRLIRDGGEDDSLAYFSTRRDKEALFASDGSAAVTYRVLNGVCLASGDPVGEQSGWRPAIEAWLAEARGYGWLPGVIGASAAGARAYAQAGMGVLGLGDEAVVTPGGFREARSAGAVRRAARHAAAEGLTVSVRRQDSIADDELASLARAAAQWRRGDERGFSMALGRVADPADGRVLYVVAHDAAHRPVGLLTLVPWGLRGASLDLMRRSPDAPHGVTELMVTELLQRTAELGLTRISLNFCLFRRTFSDAAEFGGSGLTRLNHSVLGRLDRFWQLERLYRSTSRYAPQWTPRYVCYSDGLALPQLAWAMGRAEGFIGLRPSRRRRGRPATLTQQQVDAVRAIGVRQAVQTPSDAPRSAERRVREGHRVALEASGVGAYPPATARPTHGLAEAAALAAGTEATVTGRVARLRDHGGVVFVDLADGAGTLQVVAESDALGRDSLHLLGRLVDRGDLLVVTGAAGTTRTGTPALVAASWEVAAKCLRPLPDRRWGDARARARRRTEELIVHPDALGVLRARSAAVAALRDVLAEEGYTEVETPMLQAVHGGAAARPFRTRSNATGLDLSLRIAPELYLKRLTVAGMGPLFEIGRNFRNEGVDASHNPEFTALEAYRPFADYDDMRRLTERLVRAAAVAVHGRPALPLDGGWLDLSGAWPVVSVLDAVGAAVGEPVSLDDPEGVRAIAARHGVRAVEGDDSGELVEELYAALVEPRTVAPTFYRDFPASTSLLARPHRSLPGLAERWDLVAGGRELGTAYTELTDPIEQRRRLTEQSWRAAAGVPEAMELDEDFLAALELGMPPTGGLGLGVDRLVMALTGQPIRGVLAFPFVRPDAVAGREGSAR